MPVLSLKEAAAEMHISRSKLDELIKSGEIPHVEFGLRQKRVDTADIAAWFEARKTKTYKPAPVTNPNLRRGQKKPEHSPL